MLSSLLLFPDAYPLMEHSLVQEQSSAQPNAKRVAVRRACFAPEDSYLSLAAIHATLLFWLDHET